MNIFKKVYYYFEIKIRLWKLKQVLKKVYNRYTAAQKIKESKL